MDDRLVFFNTDKIDAYRHLLPLKLGGRHLCVWLPQVMSLLSLYICKLIN